MRKILFTICGRSGSKGLKNKNIKSFLGAPFLFYSLVDALLAFQGSNLEVEKYVLVDSDSEELLTLASSFSRDIYIHKRLPALATDSIPKNVAISSALKDFEKNMCEVDCVIDLDITSPLRTKDDIKNVFETYTKKESDIIFTAVPSRRNPYFNMVERINGKVVLSKRSNFVCRQAAPIVYDMNASIYAYNPSALKKERHFFENIVDLVEMRDYGILDVDDENDFELMELIYSSIAERDNQYFALKRELAKKGRWHDI